MKMIVRGVYGRNVKEEIKELPEPKYYDDQVASIEYRISNLQEDLIKG